jgi:hypothetical protein
LIFFFYINFTITPNKKPTITTTRRHLIIYDQVNEYEPSAIQCLAISFR